MAPFVHWEAAESAYRTAIALLDEDSPGSAWVGAATAGLARVQRDAGRPDDARRLYRRAIDLMRAGWGADDPDCRRAEQELAALDGESNAR